MAGRSPQLVPLYQYWRPEKFDHFYTTKSSEIGETVPGKRGKHKAIAEGVCCNVLSAPDGPNWVPLLRYYAEDKTNHFYTTDPHEIGTTEVGRAGKSNYKYEGSEGYVCTVQAPGTIPLYRHLHNPRKDHFYTTRDARSVLDPSHSQEYNYEKVQCFVYP